MCHHKAIVFKDLMDHYSVSFESITEELEIVKERFSILMRKDESLAAHSLAQTNEIGAQLIAYSQKWCATNLLHQQELTEMKWCLKTLSGFNGESIKRYHENGFDYLPTPIITAGEPDKFKMFKWGLIPFYMSNKEKAMILRTQTINCIWWLMGYFFAHLHYFQ